MRVALRGSDRMRHVAYCAGFRTPAMTGSPRANAAGVGKAPRHEIAVGSAPGGAACAMGIWPRREGWGGWTEVFELIASSQSIGVCVAVKERRVGCAARLRTYVGTGRERGRCRLRASRNGECHCG